MTFAFEKLAVYKKSVTFAETICGATGSFPRNYAFLGNQLNRAALSIAANIAEGNGRFTPRDRRSFFGIARGSAHECAPLLEVAARRELLARDAHDALRRDLEEISRMIAGLIKAESRK